MEGAAPGLQGEGVNSDTTRKEAKEEDNSIADKEEITLEVNKCACTTRTVEGPTGPTSTHQQRIFQTSKQTRDKDPKSGTMDGSKVKDKESKEERKGKEYKKRYS